MRYTCTSTVSKVWKNIYLHIYWQKCVCDTSWSQIYIYISEATVIIIVQLLFHTACTRTAQAKNTVTWANIKHNWAIKFCESLCSKGTNGQHRSGDIEFWKDNWAIKFSLCVCIALFIVLLLIFIMLISAAFIWIK